MKLNYVKCYGQNYVKLNYVKYNFRPWGASASFYLTLQARCCRLGAARGF